MIEDPELIGLLGELNEGDGDDPVGEIVAALDKLESLDNPRLASLLCWREGMAKIKERVLVEDPNLRAMFISRLGKLVVRAWLVVNSEGFDIEGYVRVTSRTEARRLLEDFMDASIEIMKNFASGVLGHAPASDSSQVFPDNLMCSSAYSEVLTELLDQYNCAFEPLDAWADALSGLSGSTSHAVHTASGVAARSAALSLLPLLKPAMMIVFKDRYLLINRCRALPTYSNAALRLVSAFMRTLLTDLSPTASLLTLLDSAETDSGSGQSIFGSGSDDVSGCTLAGHLAVPLLSYITEYVENFLVNILAHGATSGGTSGSQTSGSQTSGSQVACEVAAVIKDIICLTQHKAMASLRHKVAPLVLQKLFYLLENHAVLFPLGENSYSELAAWALLEVRYISHLDEVPTTPVADGWGSADTSSAENKAPESIAFACYLRLFQILCEVSDNVTQTRLFTEFCVLLVHHAIATDFAGIETDATEDFTKHASSRSGCKFVATLPAALIRSACVRKLIDAGVRTAQTPVLARFVTALCATYQSLLMYTVTPVLILLPALHGATATGSVPSAAPAGFADFADFAPTVDPPKGSAKADTSADYSALLESYLAGQEELLHTWRLMRENLGSARIRRLCTSICADLRTLNVTPGEKLEAAASECVKTQCNELISILVYLLEGACFTVKTFENCFKWPLGDAAPSTAAAPATGFLRSDSAQHALTSLLQLVAKLITPTAGVGLFSTPASTGSSAVVSTKTAGNHVTDLPAKQDVITAFAPRAAPHLPAVQAVRKELISTLHLLLEWVTMDFSKVQNARYVQDLLVCLITVQVAPTEGDALGSAELILMHVRNLVYHPHVYQEYLVTLQAMSMQGVLGGAHLPRFDGLSSSLGAQLQALELLHLLAQQQRGPINSKVLQSCVQLLRTIERDFVWSEALELKCALSTTITADDAQFSGTWTNPAGTVIQKLPVSPVLKDAIFHTLQSVLALVVQPQTAAVKAWSGVMYTVSDIRAFLQQRAENTAVSLNLLTLNELTFGLAVDFTALNPELSASAPASVASTQKATPETTPARGVFALSQGALALLESFRANASDNLQDTTDPHQRFGLFTSMDRAAGESPTAALAIPAGGYVAHEDVLGQAQDVLDFHLFGTGGTRAAVAKNSFAQTTALIAAKQNSASAGAGIAPGTIASNGSAELSPYAPLQDQLASVAMLPPREKFWTTISGSGDVLTVLAASTVDQLTMKASIHVRVYNSAGFKIPTFALRLLVNGNALCVDRRPGQASFDTAGEGLSDNGAGIVKQTLNHLQRATGDEFTPAAQSTWLSTSCVLVQPGVEFFLPDAYIERTFTCSVTRFAPFEATVRIVYADLVYDEDNIYEIPVDVSESSGKSKAKTKKKARVNSTAVQSKVQYLDEYKAEHSTRWSAVLDCAPLHVPVSAQLVPYGYGSFSALRHFAQETLSMHGGVNHADLHAPGIPEDVFLCQWRRMGGRYEVSFPVGGDMPLHVASAAAAIAAAPLSMRVSAAVQDAVRTAIATYGGTGMHLLGMDAMVRLGAALREGHHSVIPYVHHSVAVGSAQHTSAAEHSAGAAWCLQTLQGAEICARLEVDQPFPLHSSLNRATGGVLSLDSAVSKLSLSAFDGISSAGASGLPGGEGNAGTAPWAGRLVLRCSEGAVMQALLADAEYLVYALTGGSVYLNQSE